MLPKEMCIRGLFLVAGSGMLGPAKGADMGNTAYNRAEAAGGSAAGLAVYAGQPLHR